MPSKPWKKVFDGPGARVRGLGSLDVEEWLFVGDPLGGDTIDARPVPGTYYVELHFGQALFRGAALEPVLARAIARNETIPIEVRFALGDPEDLWPIAAARLDAHAIGFFTRPDAACATVEPALRATVEKALHERGCVNAVMSLRRGTPPKLPG